MGTWSVTLYGSDAGNDLRADMRELFRTPMDEAAIVAALSKTHPGLKSEKDEDYPDLWLVLADQFYTRGEPAPSVFRTARSIIESGLDLDVKRRLGMDARDLKKRAKVLDDLRAKWAKPHPKPVKRKVQTAPDAFVFEVGDCAIFPVKETGKTINPYFAKPESDPDWRHDGFGAMGVLARGHYLGIFAWYGFARLNLFDPKKPTLDACATAMVEAQTTILDQRMGEKPQVCVFMSRLTPAFARKMRFEVVGRHVPNDKAIREDLAAFFKPGVQPGVCLAGELSGFGMREKSKIPLSRYLTAPRG